MRNQKSPVIDVVQDIKRLNGKSIHQKLTGIIVVGSGIIKHHIFNANLMRNGAEYCVLINTGVEYDCSDSGADLSEAITWRKIKDGGAMIKIHSEASLVFPLLVAQTFYKHFQDTQKKHV